ncbi:hypothetical protein [Herbiconiux sp. YIM B11900]|uniref:hypothetical protein n=1 Tax=Herbiconiux sp. YIM B11900 TaxID=3404131 RepID=UPI003F86370C
MTGPDTQHDPRGWRLLASWIREQKLWRDVLTRVLAGVITAAIIYAGALLLGYLHTPELAAGALLALGIAGGGILIAVAVGLLASSPGRRRAGHGILARIITAAVLVVAAAAIVTGVVIDVAS